MLICKIYRCSWSILYLILNLSCSHHVIKPVSNSTQINLSDTLYSLDVNNRSVSLPLSPKFSNTEGYKFVQVEVSKVVNPRKIFLSFEVHYQKNDEKILLGTFSLYPADNPGKFIVPSRGRLKPEGSIILSLVVNEVVKSDDTLSVVVSKINLVNK
jgi:hypothetical protein